MNSVVGFSFDVLFYRYWALLSCLHGFSNAHVLWIKLICVCFYIHWWTFNIMSSASQDGTKVANLKKNNNMLKICFNTKKEDTFNLMTCDYL